MQHPAVHSPARDLLRGRSQVDTHAVSHVHAVQVVAAAVRERLEVDASGAIIVLKVGAGGRWGRVLHSMVVLGGMGCDAHSPLERTSMCRLHEQGVACMVGEQVRLMACAHFIICRQLSWGMASAGAQLGAHAPVATAAGRGCALEGAPV